MWEEARHGPRTVTVAPPPTPTQWRDCKGPRPLLEVQEAKPPGGSEGGALALPWFTRSPPMVTDSPFRRMVRATAPDFWRLWVVGLVVFTVRWLETVAVGVVVYQRTESAFLV